MAEHQLPKLTVRVRFPSSAPKDYPAHLFAIAAIAFGLGLYGYQARRGHRPGWPRHHGIGMGGSYIALLTGFYVDNGRFLPLWNHLPHWIYWLLPSLVGVPFIWRALHRFTQSTSDKPIRAPASL